MADTYKSSEKLISRVITKIGESQLQVDDDSILDYLNGGIQTINADINTIFPEIDTIGPEPYIPIPDPWVELLVLWAAKESAQASEIGDLANVFRRDFYVLFNQFKMNYMVPDIYKNNNYGNTNYYSIGFGPNTRGKR